MASALALKELYPAVRADQLSKSGPSISSVAARHASGGADHELFRGFRDTLQAR